jgi:peptide subunit release factor 1 (eRF1)
MMSDFQKSFLGRSGMTVYTQKEFDEHLAVGKAEIMQIAIDTTKTAIAIEREECAKIAMGLAKEWSEIPDTPISLVMALEKCAENIRDRLKK